MAGNGDYRFPNFSGVSFVSSPTYNFTFASPGTYNININQESAGTTGHQGVKKSASNQDGCHSLRIGTSLVYDSTHRTREGRTVDVGEIEMKLKNVIHPTKQQGILAIKYEDGIPPKFEAE